MPRPYPCPKLPPARGQPHQATQREQQLAQALEYIPSAEIDEIEKLEAAIAERRLTLTLTLTLTPTLSLSLSLT